MRRSIVFLAAAAGSAMVPLTAASAQQIMGPALEVSPGHTLLTINAEGKSIAAPDIAVFNAGVTTQGSTAGEALSENSRKMTQVIAALKRAGVAERDIQTSNLSLNPVYFDPQQERMMEARRLGQPMPVISDEERMRRIVGYTATNNVSVRQRNLADYGKVIDALVAAGANEVNGPSFQLDNPDEAMDASRRAAMKEARDRAELYAGAAGLRIVRIVSISENMSYYQPQPIVFARGKMADMAPPPAPPPPPMQPGELQMQATVTILYELAP